MQIRDGCGGVGAATLLLVVVIASEVAERGARERTRSRNAIVEVARWLDESGKNRCAVMSTQAPQLEWYSGCTGYSMSRPTRRAVQRMRNQDHGALFLVTFERGPRELDAKEFASIQDLLVAAPSAAIDIAGSRSGVARVYRVREQLE